MVLDHFGHAVGHKEEEVTGLRFAPPPSRRSSSAAPIARVIMLPLA
jgi:hypothetical protein